MICFSLFNLKYIRDVNFKIYNVDNKVRICNFYYVFRLMDLREKGKILFVDVEFMVLVEVYIC